MMVFNAENVYKMDELLVGDLVFAAGSPDELREMVLGGVPKAYSVGDEPEGCEYAYLIRKREEPDAEILKAWFDEEEEAEYQDLNGTWRYLTELNIGKVLYMGYPVRYQEGSLSNI